MRGSSTFIKQFLVISCLLTFLVQDIECRKSHYDTGCQSCYEDDESSCDPCYNERTSKKEFKMPKIKMPKIKKSKKCKKHSCNEDDECQSSCTPMYMCPQANPCPQSCSQPYPQPFCATRYVQPSYFASQRNPDPCYRPPIQPCSRIYSRPCSQPCPTPYPQPCSRPCPQPFAQSCSKPCTLPCAPQPCPQPCSHPCPQSSNCQPPCFESTIKSNCDSTPSVQKIIVEKGPAIIQNIIFDKEFCEKYFETYGCYPAINGLPFQLPTQHVTLGNNCDDDCSTCVNSFPCASNRDNCGPPCYNDCHSPGRNPCAIQLPFPVSDNKYYPSPSPC